MTRTVATKKHQYNRQSKKFEVKQTPFLYISKFDGIKIEPGIKVRVWLPYVGNVIKTKTGIGINIGPDLKSKWYKEYRLEILEQ